MSNQQNWPDIDGNSNKCLPTDKNIATVYITVWRMLRLEQAKHNMETVTWGNINLNMEDCSLS